MIRCSVPVVVACRRRKILFSYARIVVKEVSEISSRYFVLRIPLKYIKILTIF